MKKNNNLGFFLAETMVVIVVVTVVLLGIFKLFSSVYMGFRNSEGYNSANAINALSNIQRYYENFGKINKDIVADDYYVDLTNSDMYLSDYYKKLKEELNIELIYMINLNKYFDFHENNVFYLSLRRYINTLKNIGGVVVVVVLENEEYAYIELLDYSNVELIGNKDDEYVVYVPIGTEFIDPGYINWEERDPVITWENGVEIDNTKPGTFYLHYDFGGKILRRKVIVGNIELSKYISNLIYLEPAFNNGLIQATVEYNGTQYNAGIRYVGSLEGDNAVNNQVYFNCDPEYTSDSKTIKYGDEDYIYKDHCEIWRIIGLFEVEDEKGNIEKRIKIININSIFKASWDSSASNINEGWGINQWGEVKDLNGLVTYPGADLMQLLNGYYVGKTNSVCTYCDESEQDVCKNTCDAKMLKESNLKVLTDTAKGIIEDAVWDVFAVSENDLLSSETYLMEKGISEQYTGNSECKGKGYSNCNDNIKRTTSWAGLVGLMSSSDVVYADGWLYNGEVYPWTITPRAVFDRGRDVKIARWDGINSWGVGGNHCVWPSVYLKSSVKIISGNGNDDPYVLK